MINAIQAVLNFQGTSLKENLAKYEHELIGNQADEISCFCDGRGIDTDFLDCARSVKKAVSQINVIVHATGILHSLKTLLEDGEVVEILSLGAGSTGKNFDLETNFRVAEYKFADWKGGSESKRQNPLFKDFYTLAEYETTKRKYLYVVDETIPLKFFNGGRALESVLSGKPKILASLNTKYAHDVKVVRDYYSLYKDNVSICDIRPYLAKSSLRQ